MEQYIDIIFFAILAGFLFFKLRQVLGDYNEEDKPPSSSSSELKDVTPSRQSEKKGSQVITMPVGLHAVTTSRSVLDAVKQTMMRHPDFDPIHFVQGATRAFDMIVNAYVSGNKDLLRKLMTPELYQHYETDINDRHDKGHVLDITVHKIKSAKISDVDVRENITRIAVTFDVEETIFTRDQNGDIIDGDPTLKEDAEDIWVFEQEIETDDPTWYLAQTDIEGDETKKLDER